VEGQICGAIVADDQAVFFLNWVAVSRLLYRFSFVTRLDSVFDNRTRVRINNPSLRLDAEKSLL
jgi:hypothetical protein